MGRNKAEGVHAPGEGPELDASVVLLVPLLVALALWSLPRAIQAGDAGEFATVMLTGGVPHPSGYPWMRLLGLLSQGLWAAGLPPITAAALPPAMCGVIGWLLIHRCTARLGHPRIGAFVVLLCASAPLSVIHVNDSEVWGPHLLGAAAFLHTVIRTRERPRPFALGLSFGIAVSLHLTAALLLPLAIGAAWPRATKQPLVDLLRNGAIGVGSGLIGLLPYASLAIGRGGAWRWGETETLAGLVDHVLRRDFGTFSLSLHEEQVHATDSLARALTSVGEVFTAELASAWWVGAALLVLASIGAAAWIRHNWIRHNWIRREGDPPLGVAIGWALAMLASALVFPAIGNIDPTYEFGAWILERFDLLTVLLMVVPITLALAELGRVSMAKLEAAGSARSTRLLRVGAWAIAAALLFAQLGAAVARGRPAIERAVELAAIDLVSTPDPQGPAIPSVMIDGEPVRAIVIGTDDHRSFPVLYVQSVLGAGPHTLYIDARLLAYPWYRARLRERVPTLPDVDKPLALIGAIWSDPELAAVPIYLANVFSRPAAGLEKVPEGLLWRVPPPPDRRDASAWTPEQILARHLAASARMSITAADFGGLEHPRGHPWSGDLQFAYVDKARALARWLAANGHAQSITAIEDALEDALEQRTGAKLDAAEPPQDRVISE